jgi:hypothetical protein
MVWAYITGSGKKIYLQNVDGEALSTQTRTLKIPEIIWQGREDGSWTDLVQHRTQMRALVPRVCFTPGDGPFPWDIRSLRVEMEWVVARVGLGSLNLISALFWDFTQGTMVVCCRRFGITYRSYRQWSSLTLDPWVGPLTMGPIGCRETSILGCVKSPRRSGRPNSQNLLVKPSRTVKADVIYCRRVMLHATGVAPTGNCVQ